MLAISNSPLIFLLLFLVDFDIKNGTKKKERQKVAFSRLAVSAQINSSPNKLKITTECGPQLITLHVQFNENLLPTQRFSDWIIVGNTMRPECRLKGNGELRYIVQIAVHKDPCATKMISPGIFQNTLRIASFPGLILSEDLNYEFKCVYGMPEVTEFRLPQSQQAGINRGTNTFGGIAGNGNGQGPPPMLITGTEQQQQLNSPNLQISPSASSSISATGSGHQHQNGQSKNNLLLTGGEFVVSKENREEREQQQNANLIDGEFDVSNQWEQRRNSFSSNIVVGMASLLGLFLLGCVFLAFFYSVKQYRLAKGGQQQNHPQQTHSPFTNLDSRISPGENSSSFSPASDESSRGGQRQMRGGGDREWGRATSDSNSTAIASNVESQTFGEHLNLEPMPIPSIGSSSSNFRHKNVNQINSQHPLLLKSLHSSSANRNSINVLSIETTGNDGQKLMGNGGELLKAEKKGNCVGMNGGENWRSDNDALREDFNTAACRSITEIYRSAEMKLKNMMMTNGEEGVGRNGAGASKEGEYSTPKKVQIGRERQQILLINSVNKIRGYGTRKLTEQEMLRWRQLVRNDPNFQNLIVRCTSVEELHKVSEMPQFRLLFTKLKWTQIVQCIADELFGNENIEEGQNERSHQQELGGTIRRTSGRIQQQMAPMPLFNEQRERINPAVDGGNGAANLKIYVGNSFSQERR